jgi:hypothetical protein
MLKKNWPCNLFDMFFKIDLHPSIKIIWKAKCKLLQDFAIRCGMIIEKMFTNYLCAKFEWTLCFMNYPKSMTSSYSIL